MSAESPDTTLQSIALDIEKLKRQSQSTIPVAVLGLILVVGGLVYSVVQLNSVRSDIADRRKELADVDLLLKAKTVQLAQAQKRLDDGAAQLSSLGREVDGLSQRIATAAAATSQAQKNAALDAAVVQAQDLNAAISTASAAAATEAAAARYGNYRVDLFYCADRAARNKPLAEQARALGQGGATQGKWQVRALSEKANASPGYGIRSDVIRFESDEKAMAAKLREDVAKLTQVSLSAQQIGYHTQNYISVFFCGAG